MTDEKMSVKILSEELILSKYKGKKLQLWKFWSKISNMNWSDDITWKKEEETLTTKMTSTKHVNPDYTKVISCSMCEDTFVFNHEMEKHIAEAQSV